MKNIKNVLLFFIALPMLAMASPEIDSNVIDRSKEDTYYQQLERKFNSAKGQINFLKDIEFNHLRGTDFEPSYSCADVANTNQYELNNSLIYRYKVLVSPAVPDNGPMYPGKDAVYKQLLGVDEAYASNINAVVHSFNKYSDTEISTELNFDFHNRLDRVFKLQVRRGGAYLFYKASSNSFRNDIENFYGYCWKK